MKENTYALIHQADTGECVFLSRDGHNIFQWKQTCFPDDSPFHLVPDGNRRRALYIMSVLHQKK